MKSGLLHRMRSLLPLHYFAKNDTIDMTDTQSIQNMQKEYCRKQVQYMQENLSLFLLRFANMVRNILKIFLARVFQIFGN